MWRTLLDSGVIWFSLNTVTEAFQPIIESMVECGVLYSAASFWVKNSENTRGLKRAAHVWEHAAKAQARAEGRETVQEYVLQMWLTKCNKWSEKGATYYLSQDFRDWTGYCRTLVRSRGLAIDPGWTVAETFLPKHGFKSWSLLAQALFSFQQWPRSGVIRLIFTFWPAGYATLLIPVTACVTPKAWQIPRVISGRFNV